MAGGGTGGGAEGARGRTHNPLWVKVPRLCCGVAIGVAVAYASQAISARPVVPNAGEMVGWVGRRGSAPSAWKIWLKLVHRGTPPNLSSESVCDFFGGPGGAGAELL